MPKGKHPNSKGAQRRRPFKKYIFKPFFYRLILTRAHEENSEWRFVHVYTQVEYKKMLPRHRTDRVFWNSRGRQPNPFEAYLNVITAEEGGSPCGVVCGARGIHAL